MKLLRLILTNVFVLSILILIISIISYFVGVHKINNFFKLKGENQIAYLQYDSIAMFVHQPNIQIYDNWGTPNQRLTTERRTNNLGFREDLDITKQKLHNEYRILVTGDSHTDGVLKHNWQSFINIWENNLNTKDNTQYYNCINGGTGYYTFRNYLGFLKKYKYLKPDVYLINIFTGNDFRETFLYEDDRTSVSNVCKTIYIRSKRKLHSKEQKKIPPNQGLDQTLYFKHFSDDKERSLNIAKKYISEIKEVCKQENIELIITLLPSKLETNILFKNEVQSLFNFDEETININKKLTLSLRDWLDKEQIKYYDLKKPLKNANEKVYWDQDLHINVNGHRIIGDYLTNNVLINKK
ncbi:SGNH/GDSL hydrolase family protein [Aquimarina sp. M1]